MKYGLLIASLCALAIGCSKDAASGAKRGGIPGTFVLAEGIGQSGHAAQISLRSFRRLSDAGNGTWMVRTGAMVTNKSVYLLSAVELELQIRDVAGKTIYRKLLTYSGFEDDLFQAGPYLLPNMNARVFVDTEVPTDVLAQMNSYWYEVNRVEAFEKSASLDEPLNLFTSVFASPPKARIAISGNPAYLSAKDESSGLTLTHVAFLTGDTTLIDLLVSQNADLKVKSKLGIMPIHCAALSNYDYGLRLLKDKGISLESKDVYGRTPLMIACRYGNASHAMLALQQGARVSTRDKAGVTAFWYVCQNYLWDRTQFAQEMKKYGFNPNEWSTKTLHPLHIAIDPKLTDYLCSNGAKVNGYEKGTTRWTPLHAAAKAGTVEQIAVLLNRGADPTLKTHPAGNTAADIARKYQHFEHERVLRTAMQKRRTKRR